MIGRSALVAVGALATVAVAGATAIADGESSLIDLARERIADVRYEDAAQLVDQALLGGGLSAADTAEAYRIGGRVHAALGDEERARDHFERYVTLVPDGELPPGMSPKITVPFEAARARAQERGPLRVRHRIERGGGALRVEIDIISDPLELVTGVRVTYRLDGDEAPLLAESRRRMEVDARAPDSLALTVVVTAIDEHGNDLVAFGSPQEPIRVAPAAIATVVGRTTARRRPWYQQWYAWAGVAGASAGVGAYFALRVDSAQDDLDALNASSGSHQFSEARAVEERGNRDARIADVSFGAAGVALVVAVATAIRGSHYEHESASGQDSTALVEPMAIEGGAGLSLRLRF